MYNNIYSYCYLCPHLRVDTSHRVGVEVTDDIFQVLFET